MDLGTSIRRNQSVNTDKYKSTAPSSIDIKDEFIKKYLILTGKQICKSGTLGSLSFYEDLTLGHKELMIFKDDEMFEIQMEDKDLQENIKSYLGNLLKMLEEHEIQKKDLIVEGIILTEEDVKKFEFGIPRPRMDLPKEQYIEAMINRRKRISEVLEKK
jgi:hypothetical protein